MYIHVYVYKPLSKSLEQLKYDRFLKYEFPDKIYKLHTNQSILISVHDI